MAKKQCILKSVNETHPDIKLFENETNFIGRTRETLIADSLVSKKHLKVRVNFDKKCIVFENIGLNPSTLNGVILEKDKEHTAYHDDVIEIIPSKYPYKVHIESDEVKPNSALEHTERKRKRSADDGSIVELPCSKKLKWKMDIFLDFKQKSPDTSWQSYNNGQLLVYTSHECKPSNKIAAYDMDGTLIKTKSGKVFPTNIDDWKLAYGTVVSTIKSKHSDGYKIVIFTNQAGVTSGKTKMADIKKKIENIINTLGVPIMAFIATGDNCFRKPLTGMWQALCEHKNDDVPIDISQSYFVGDAAGRPENKMMKKKKDHSSADRFFAMNVGLDFFTPEEHFLKASKQSWTKPEFDIKDFLSRTVQLINNPNTMTTSTDLELIVMIGAPGTGKSYFCEKYLQANGYEIISRDKIGTWQKCVDRVNDCLKSGRKVVVDNTNGDRESRARYVNAAKKHKIPCRCFVMTTSFKHAEHNIAFREMTDTKHSKISKIVLNSYKKNFQEPSIDEGFTEIVRINFVPTFENDREKFLYEMYLLASY